MTFGRCIMNFIYPALAICSFSGVNMPSRLVWLASANCLPLLENPICQIFELLLQGVAGFFDEILLFGDDLFLLLVPCREPGDLLSQFFSRRAQLPFCLGVIQRFLQGLVRACSALSWDSSGRRALSCCSRSCNWLPRWSCWVRASSCSLPNCPGVRSIGIATGRQQTGSPQPPAATPPQPSQVPTNHSSPSTSIYRLEAAFL